MRVEDRRERSQINPLEKEDTAEEGLINIHQKDAQNLRREDPSHKRYQGREIQVIPGTEPASQTQGPGKCIQQGREEMTQKADPAGQIQDQGNLIHQGGAEMIRKADPAD